jgi:hypothetical protein
MRDRVLAAAQGMPFLNPWSPWQLAARVRALIDRSRHGFAFDGFRGVIKFAKIGSSSRRERRL